MPTHNEILEKIPEWVRWILIPFVALLTVTVVWFVALIAAKVFIFLGDDRGFSENFFTYLLNPGVATYCSVNASVSVAPRYKNATAISVSALWIFIAGGLTFFILHNHDWKSLIQVVSFCVGAAAALESSHD